MPPAPPHDKLTGQHASVIKIVPGRLRAERVATTMGRLLVGVANWEVRQRPTPKPFSTRKVPTSPMACCRRDSRLAECKAVMTSKRIQRLPVVEDGTLYGIISAGDILASECDGTQETIEHLQEYLYGHR